MRASDIILQTNRILVKRGTRDGGDLSASQLRNVLTDLETLIGDAISVAHCEHAGSRWKKVGDDAEHCGVCSRKVEA